MFQLEVFVREVACAIDASASSPIAIDKVSSLNHEVLDDTMNSAVLVPLWSAGRVLGLASTELSEVPKIAD